MKSFSVYSNYMKSNGNILYFLWNNKPIFSWFIEAMDRLDHVTTSYINSFMQDNFFHSQNIFLKIWET